MNEVTQTENAFAQNIPTPLNGHLRSPTACLSEEVDVLDTHEGLDERGLCEVEVEVHVAHHGDTNVRGMYEF